MITGQVLGFDSTPYVLSIRQPWVELILSGQKTIEVRTWKTNFRGELYLHAGKSIDYDAVSYYNLGSFIFTTGSILGRALLTDCIKFDQTSWETLRPLHLNYDTLDKNKYGFILEKIERIEPIPMKGKLGIFTCTIQ